MAYAYGVQAGNLVFVSGQLATDASGALVGGNDVEAQAMKCFENVESVIAEAGGTRADIVKISVHLAQASYLEAMQRARRRFFTDPDFPASIAVFILPPSMTILRQRLLARASDSSDEIQRRLQKVKEEVWSYREYAYIVKNDDLTRSLRDLENIFLGERLRTKRLNMAWIENNFILDDDAKPGDRKDLP